MTLVDTHIWVWWMSDPARLRPLHRSLLETADEVFAISVISCREVAKLAEYVRLHLDRRVDEWIDSALSVPNLQLLPLTPAIAIASTQLPAPFHRDPADRIIVATARVHHIPLMTEDSRILTYPHVQLACA